LRQFYTEICAVSAAAGVAISARVELAGILLWTPMRVTTRAVKTGKVKIVFLIIKFTFMFKG
jgi:hypothetical protein